MIYHTSFFFELFLSGLLKVKFQKTNENPARTKEGHYIYRLIIRAAKKGLILTVHPKTPVILRARAKCRTKQINQRRRKKISKKARTSF
jgi:hypothetical protein